MKAKTLIAYFRKLCPGADVKKGLAIRGGNVKNAGKEIAAWLNNIK